MNDQTWYWRSKATCAISIARTNTSPKIEAILIDIGGKWIAAYEIAGDPLLIEGKYDNPEDAAKAVVAALGAIGDRLAALVEVEGLPPRPEEVKP